MKSFRLFLAILIFALSVGAYVPVNAQCAMCTATVETNSASGATTTSGLNNGIMYLLAAPYLAVAIAGYIWYKKYRKKDIPMEMHDEKLHLN